MQPHTKHSHMSPEPHIGSHTFVSLLRSHQGHGDLAWHSGVRPLQHPPNTPPTNTIINTSTNGVADYNDGIYFFLPSDPNP
jgi:hypothetical protein